MELRHLKYFIAVAEELHFGRAARRLHMAQPPLSTQIRQLEEELGVALFHRANRRVTLTNAGEVFLEEARSIMQRVDAGVHLARRADGGHAGTLSIGYVDEAVHFVLPPLLEEFRRLYPEVTVRLQEMHSSEQEAALECRRVDFTFGYTRPASEEMGVRAVLSGDVVLAMPATHPLARRRGIDLAMFADEPFIFPVRESSPHLHDLLMSLCHEAGVVPQIAHRAEHIYSVMGLVRCGAGVSLVPTFLRAEEWADVTFKKLGGVATRLEMVASWCSDLAGTRLHRNFIGLLAGR